jgi:hypothetical protein
MPLSYEKGRLFLPLNIAIACLCLSLLSLSLPQRPLIFPSPANAQTSTDKPKLDKTSNGKTAPNPNPNPNLPSTPLILSHALLTPTPSKSSPMSPFPTIPLTSLFFLAPFRCPSLLKPQNRRPPCHLPIPSLLYQRPPSISPSPSPLTADTGCTGVLLQFSNVSTLSPFFTSKPLPIVPFTLPDRSTFSVGGLNHLTGQLTLPHKSSPVSCYFLPDSDLSHSLTGISPLLRPNGCAVYTSNSVDIFDSPSSLASFLFGIKSSSSDLWFLSVSSSSAPPQVSFGPYSANFTLSI